jgi:TIR domain
LTFFTTLSVFAMCYLLVRLARRGFVLPAGSDILFELEWMPNYVEACFRVSVYKKEFSPETIFISYSRSDGRAFAEAFERRLEEEAGIRAWRDRRRHPPASASSHREGEAFRSHPIAPWSRL